MRRKDRVGSGHRFCVYVLERTFYLTRITFYLIIKVQNREKGRERGTIRVLSIDIIREGGSSHFSIRLPSLRKLLSRDVLPLARQDRFEISPQFIILRELARRYAASYSEITDARRSVSGLRVVTSTRPFPPFDIDVCARPANLKKARRLSSDSDTKSNSNCSGALFIEGSAHTHVTGAWSVVPK